MAFANHPGGGFLVLELARFNSSWNQHFRNGFNCKQSGKSWTRSRRDSSSNRPLGTQLQRAVILLAQIRNTGNRKRRAKGKDSAATGEKGNGNSDTPRVNAISSATATTHRVELASGGTLTVSITANPFKMPQTDRDFVFSLIDMLQKYEVEHSLNEIEEPDDEEEES